MTSLSGLGIGLSLVFGLLFLALVGEVYYLLWWKKRLVGDSSRRGVEEDDYYYTTSSREFLDLFCWKKPSSLASKHPEICTSVRVVDGSDGGHPTLDPKDPTLKPPFSGGGGDGEEESLDMELIRLHNLCGPPRILFTIKEETKEDLESEDGRPRRRTLSDLLLAAAEHSPLLTPLPSPPLYSTTPPKVPLHSYDKHGFNPLFESQVVTESDRQWVWPSPPPTFKFLRDAEEKLYRKTLVEEALKVHTFGCVGKSSPHPPPEASASDETDGSFTAISIGSSTTHDIPRPSPQEEPSFVGLKRNEGLVGCSC